MILYLLFTETNIRAKTIINKEESTIMIVKATPAISKEVRSRLKLGAFTFVREETGRVVLHVDVNSGLYPLRLTNEQTATLAQWLRDHNEEETGWSRVD